jgi:hypothetical protein
MLIKYKRNDSVDFSGQLLFEGLSREYSATSIAYCKNIVVS